jgi:MarR family transcriptional regulator, 2-MHQ and catechol-resistance regulon repressor
VHRRVLDHTALEYDAFLVSQPAVGAPLATGAWSKYLSTKMNPPAAAKRATAKRVPRPKTAGLAFGVQLKLWVVLSRAYGAVSREAELDIARHGLTSMEFGILEVLHHKGPLLLGEIQRKVLVTSGGITYLVDRLEAKGLVKRQQCPNDRRARYAVLTPAGAALIRRIFPAHAKAIARALSGLGNAEQVQATKLLRRLGVAAAELADE